jgi:hypothetical protein
MGVISALFAYNFAYLRLRQSASGKPERPFENHNLLDNDALPSGPRLSAVQLSEAAW